jgi:hypothetical protein
MSRRLVPALCIAIGVALWPSPAPAQRINDGHVWVLGLATVRLSENWRLHLEEQPRWFDNASESFQIITRTALGRRVGSRASLWGGYAWVAKPPGPGTVHEHRLWQQLSATFPDAGLWTPSLRLRLEQRFQNTWEGSSHRLRTLGRMQRPVTADRRWSLVVWDEVFLTMDETPRGPWDGLDQNRLFGGLLRQFSPKVGLEFGYLWTTLEPPGGRRQHQHVAFTWLNLTL